LRLTNKARKLFLDVKNEIYLSQASIWEMAIKISLKKLDLNESLKNFVQTKVIGNNIKIMQISAEHLYLIESLVFHHSDPFDRLIISQCLVENMPVITQDPDFGKYKIKCIWK
jgi:PIN domain nuclease of toxin-antitoxin system